MSYHVYSCTCTCTVCVHTSSIDNYCKWNVVPKQVSASVFKAVQDIHRYPAILADGTMILNRSVLEYTYRLRLYRIYTCTRDHLLYCTRA